MTWRNKIQSEFLPPRSFAWYTQKRRTPIPTYLNHRGCENRSAGTLTIWKSITDCSPKTAGRRRSTIIGSKQHSSYYL